MTQFREDLLDRGSDPIAQQRDMDLAAKYACQGPRYTSYPTTPQLRQDFPLDQYYSWQHSGGDHKTAPLSLYVHLPFCQETCHYCTCYEIVTRDKNTVRNYLRHLQTEIDMQSQLFGKNRPVTQMHWGGGTPTFLDNAEITELMHMLACHFRLLDKTYRDYSIEIDPGTAQPDTIALLKGLGFNRIRLGIQDFDPQVQQANNRFQDYSQVESLVDCIRVHDFRSLSFDLTYGLPRQDRCSMEETLRKVIALRPDRISCYNYVHRYAHRPEYCSSQHAIDRLYLPSSHEHLMLQQIIAHRLQDAGYLHIGMDSYVLPRDELALALQEGRLQRNFQGYSLQLADDLLGLGVSASSQVGDFYLQNERELAGYYARIDHGQHPTSRGFRVSHEDKLRRYIIMSLICELKLDIPECSRRFGIEFHGIFHKELLLMRAMEADGLLNIDLEGIQVSHRGRPFLRNICMLFDAYLEIRDGGPSSPRISPANS